MTYRKLSPQELLKCCFDDTLSEADEYITSGELTPGEVIEQFVDSLISAQKYFQDKAQAYDQLNAAITERYRNR